MKKECFVFIDYEKEERWVNDMAERGGILKRQW